MHRESGLLTDLYELTMAAGYVETGFSSRATFELFARHLPPHRSYLVVAGIEEALDYLGAVHFTRHEIGFLRRHPAFRHSSQKFFDYLARFRFTGDVWAMPEGTVAFAGEPLLRVRAPIAEAQLVETYLLAAVHFQTLIATKAARVVKAARGRSVIEFGARRAHGLEAGVLAARAAWLAGCDGTSNSYAGRLYRIPTFGTQAHSWVMAYPTEAEAFARFLDVFPDSSTLLVDTYDTRRAIERIVRQGRKPAGIRLDSGDLLNDSIWARQRLRRAGWGDVRIFASGDLDEYRIDSLLRAGAEVDGFGVGTSLVTSSDAPSVGVIYKLVEVRRGGRRVDVAKFSPAKATYPGPKQVFRFRDRSGRAHRDLIALENERPRGGEPLLLPALRNGRRVRPAQSLADARERCRRQLELLPERYQEIDRQARFPVSYSPRLKRLFERMRRASLAEAR
ncbi:MAG TPA: nicotinate phosphoribosyltransferase [Candidatus Acidoferrales bacterium]|nr:nicotinate phosphoribosyltransferase [Candidatus Acidoferrales bacterium]